MCVPSRNTHFRVSRKLLVKGHIANIGPQSHHFCIVLFSVNYGFLNFPVFFLSSQPSIDQPNVDNGGVSRGSVPVAVGVSDM